MHIGVLDSGIGGLALLAQLVSRFPDNKFTYYSDNRYAPYGSRNIGYLKWRVHAVCTELKERGADILALGCNTAGSNLYDELRASLSVPVTAVRPEAYPDKEKTLIMCTPLTARSEWVKAYADSGAGIYADPALVPLIEKHRFDLGPVAEYAVSAIAGYGAEAISLGCTHYVYLKKYLTSALGVKCHDGCSRAADDVALYPVGGESHSISYVFSGEDQEKEYDRLLQGLLEDV